MVKVNKKLKWTEWKYFKRHWLIVVLLDCLGLLGVNWKYSVDKRQNFFLVKKIQTQRFWISVLTFLFSSSFQETHQQLADRTGLNVVELRAECGMRPVIVASPSVETQKKVLKKRSDKDEYDLNEIFDPYRGLHRPKKRTELLWTRKNE